MAAGHPGGSDTDQHRAEQSVAVSRLDAASIRICVSDSGAGVADEMQDRLFDSFETSKPEGMGLGLSISRTLIEAHGGNLWLDQARPARFCFNLPIRMQETSNGA